MPFRRLTIHSPLSADEVEKRVAALICPPRGFLERMKSLPSPRPFEGELGSGAFKISRAITGRNSFLPQIRGTIQSTEAAGTDVRLIMTLHPLVWAFVLWWFWWVTRGVDLSFASRLANGDLQALGDGAFVVFGALLTVFLFYPESFKAERIIREALTTSGSTTQ